MRDRIIKNLKARFAAYDDLIEQLDDAALEARIDAPKHKSLKEHLWCIVGARESYAAALEAGEWCGFNCSMTNYTTDDFRTALRTSADKVMSSVNAVAEWTETHDDLIATLSEHEVMHEGQIIRHVYGLSGVLPQSWKWA